MVALLHPGSVIFLESFFSGSHGELAIARGAGAVVE
jgi:hypothetical protein